MTLFVVSIILSAAMLHAVWNAIVKTAADRTTMLGLVALGHVIPGAAMVVLLPLPAPESMPYVLASTLIHFGYFYMLGRAYAHGDLSVVYPIARGIVPALVALWAMIFAGEVLPLQAWAGIALIALGIQLSSWQALRSGVENGVGRAALGYAVGTGFCISAYSLTDGLGVRLSGNTLSYWAWGAFLHLFVAGFIGLRKRNTLAALRPRTWIIGIGGGLVSMTAYGLVLYAKNFAPLGAVSALRETSVIFAALIGFVFLKEGNWIRRLGAAVLMAGGVALIGTSL
ncbi:MAG: DMT family transporter [Pseudophaeobacter sp. bin_em_oilr2.035]|uniref:DMT family transporter n=1 Tax=Phaeobacter gallaeciensis TaxID=60890 RepID=A0ABD4XDE9_9RHOB|nr:DMT family transporter [Phaeobacter gallaeciensis]MDF1771860.1 DMT family transporter [Pseudophaeobacter sp. bin_em_oilr2.035]MDE4146259.1 DMT family transporter [Phaeobacter gallaeciensis]MDE4158856.1 DMT family transporter [Phaeobacter gallaeciensis]MDE4163109.1 DMT family transporter [Phaeobacter gallaeciensis]MDE4167339.1 DMT family transporter [Phaeobacter gallaeciensis]